MTLMSIRSPEALARLLAAETGRHETDLDGIFRAARGRHHASQRLAMAEEKLYLVERSLDMEQQVVSHLATIIEDVRVECSRALGMGEVQAKCSPLPIETIAVAIRDVRFRIESGIAKEQNAWKATEVASREARLSMAGAMDACRDCIRVVRDAFMAR